MTWSAGLVLAVSAFTDWYSAGQADGLTIAVAEVDENPDLYATSPGKRSDKGGTARWGEVACFWAAPSVVDGFSARAGAFRDHENSQGEASSSSYFPRRLRHVLPTTFIRGK